MWSDYNQSKIAAIKNDLHVNLLKHLQLQINYVSH